MEYTLLALERVRWSPGLPASLPRRPLRAVGFGRLHPRRRLRAGNRQHAAKLHALLPTSRRPAVRFDAHGTPRRRRGTPIRQGRGQPLDFSDERRASLPRVRDQRPRLPATCRSAGVEYVGGFLRPPYPQAVSALPVEFQLVAVLDDQRASRGARVQHEHAYHVQQHLVAPRRRHDRAARHDVLLRLRARRAGGPAEFLHLPLAGHQWRRPQDDRPVPVVQLVPWGWRTITQFQLLAGA